MAGREWPEDVLRDILSMLPVKSLMRFRCVCKLWCALIKCPTFIAQHLNNRGGASSSTRKTVIVKRSRQHDNRIVLSLMNLISSDDIDQLILSTDIDIIDTLFPKDENYLGLSGSCNGIICISHHNCQTIVLCNPSIREFKVVPVPPLEFTTCNYYPPTPSLNNLMSHTRAVGFGFDPMIDEYKVVRIVGIYHDYDDHLYDPQSVKIEVYNLSSNSWREINDAIVPTHFDYIPWYVTIVNGALHWYAVGIDGYPDSFILSFHISNERIQIIQLPHHTFSYEYPEGYSETLIALNESSLAFVIQADDQYLDIWVMIEYGVKESWTRQFKIGPLSGINRPIEFWNNGRDLLMETGDGQLVSCNLQDHNVKEFPLYGVPGTLCVLTYSESLVSINREQNRRICLIKRLVHGIE